MLLLSFNNIVLMFIYIEIVTNLNEKRHIIYTYIYHKLTKGEKKKSKKKNKK